MEALLDPNMLIIVGMFAVIYFFMIRPQQQKAKAQTQFLDELSKGDEVVTTGGIIGKVTKVEDTIVTISLDGKTSVKLTKGAISKEMTDAYVGE